MPIQPVRPSTNTTSNRLGSHNATKTNNTTRRGMARTVSVAAINARSVHPPPTAAAMPTAQPSTTDTATERMPTVSEIR